MMGCFQQAVVGSLALNGVLLVVRWIYRAAVKTRGVHVLTQHCTSDPSIARGESQRGTPVVPVCLNECVLE